MSLHRHISVGTQKQKIGQNVHTTAVAPHYEMKPRCGSVLVARFRLFPMNRIAVSHCVFTSHYPTAAVAALVSSTLHTSPPGPPPLHRSILCHCLCYVCVSVSLCLCRSRRCLHITQRLLSLFACYCLAHPPAQLISPASGLQFIPPFTARSVCSSAC